MPSIGNPYTLYNVYRKLPIQLFGNSIPCNVDVHKYRNNELGGSASTLVGRGTHEKMKSQIKTYGQRISGDKFWVYFPLVKTT